MSESVESTESTELESRIDVQEIPIPYLTLNGQQTEIVAADPSWDECAIKIEASVTSMAKLLIFGETGTGKTVVAKTIHRLSGRTGELVSFECSGVSEDSFYTKLFGAIQRRRSVGLCRIADNGTLIIHNIDELTPRLQGSLASFLENQVIRPIGGEDEISVNVRIICTMHIDPNQSVSSGKLRDDIFYKISTVKFEIKPLRERKQDIRPLVAHFLTKSEFNKAGTVKFISQQFLENLEAYSWHGNVLELENVLERAYLNCSNSDGDTLLVEHLPDDIKLFNKQRIEIDKPISHEDFPSLAAETKRIHAEVLQALQPEVERKVHEQLRGYVTLILHLTRGNLLRAAKILQTDQQELEQLLSTLNIPIPVAVLK